MSERAPPRPAPRQRAVRVTNRPPTACMPRKSIWVRDVTEEGIEPHPGPARVCNKIRPRSRAGTNSTSVTALSAAPPPTPNPTTARRSMRLGAPSGAAALSTAETFLSFHSDESLATALRAGLQMGIATGVFLVILAVIGCVATCRLSTVGLTVFVSLLGVAIVLQVAGAALIFNFGSQLNAIPISDISVKLNGTSTPSISGKTGLDLEKEAFEEQKADLLDKLADREEAAQNELEQERAAHKARVAARLALRRANQSTAA